MKKNRLITLLIAAVLPQFAFAAIASFRDLLQTFIVIMGNVMSLLYAAAIAGFFFGVMTFVLNGNDEKKRTEGKKWMAWTIFALFIMLTVWGLVGVLVGTFGLGLNVIPQLPS
jgi:membrane associated rhomboid family serine protease